MKRHVWMAKSLFTILTLSVVSVIWARPERDVWLTKHTPMPSKRVGFSTSEVNGKIYVIGGTFWDERPRNGRVVRTVEEYDPVTNRWKLREGIRIGRSHLASSTVNGKIFAIGGIVQVGWKRKHVEEFNPASDTWETKTDMLEPRAYFIPSVVGGKIYVLGGADDGSAEAYDPAANSWERKTPMPKQRWWFSTSVANGKIYAIGGVTWNPERYLESVEVYDPATDTWEKRADMPTPRCCLSVNTVNGVIYAIGGVDGSGRLKTVEAYDPATDEWKQMADMPDPGGGFSSSVVDEKIYLIKGGAFTSTLFIYTPLFVRPPRGVNPMGKAATTWGQVRTGR